MNWMELNDLNHKELEVYTHLKEPQLKHYYEPHGGLFIAESLRIIERALDAGCEPVSLFLERRIFEHTSSADIRKRCENIPVYVADHEVMCKMTGYEVTRGALCAMRRPVLPRIDEICTGAKRIAVLYDIMNPTNVGAIFRSAAALGMDAVLLTGKSSDPYYRRAARVSMGTVFQIPWTYLPQSVSQTECPGHDTSIGLLKKMGFCTAAMALHDHNMAIDDPRLAGEDKLAIILGTEGDGLPDNVIENCDHTVYIPMDHEVDSLNVAAASAVAFWQLRRKEIS